MISLNVPDRAFAGYIFDCDGTLTDNMPLHYIAWKRAMEEVGGQYPEELFYQWGGKPTTVIIEALNEKYGLSMDPIAVSHRKEDLYEELIPEVKPFAPVVEYVHKFYGKAPLAVASGGYRRLVEGTLRAMNLMEFFPVIVTAEDYKNGKPAPDPFLLAAEKMGVPPSECLVFEDSPTGIVAAEAAGMAHVLVPTGQMALERLKAQKVEN